MKTTEGKGIKIDLQDLFKLWEKYKKDPKVLYDPNPSIGMVFSFEGFWYWLIKKYNKKCKHKYLTFGVKCLKCGKPR